VAKPRAVRAQPEELLLAYAERLTHHRAGRRAVFIRLSALTPTDRSEERFRRVETLLAPLVRHHGGEIFRLRTGDIAAVLGSADRALAERVSHKLIYLFRDDPFVESAPKTGEGSFVRWFDLSKDYEAFHALAREIKQSAEGKPARAKEASPQRHIQMQKLLPPFRSGELRASALIRFLYDKPEGTRAIARLCHPRTVMRLRENETPTAAFEWLSPRPDVASLIGFPQGDLDRNPALAEALAHAVLRRLVVELPEGRPGREALLVNAHLEGLLGLFFLAFHKAWSTGPWHPVTFLLPLEETRADPSRFRYACKFLHGLGHRIGVSGLAFSDITNHKLAALDIDMAVIPFDDNFTSDGDGEALMRSFGRRFTPEDAERVLLDGVDTPQALFNGLKLGISLFAGRQAQARLSWSQAQE
jgi:hypothetical protein